MDKAKVLADGKAVGRAVVARRAGGPEVLELISDHAVPAPGPGEILVKMASSGVNPVDCIMRAGGVPPLVAPAAFPCVLGGDGAGTVFIAPDGSKFKEGDRVIFNTNGAVPRKGNYSATYAEFCVMREEWAAKAPSTVPLEDAGGISLAGLSALVTVDSLPCAPGSRVLCLGASGGVGQFAVQLAKLKGWRVTAACSPQHADQVLSLGADDVFDYTAEGASAADALRRRFGEGGEEGKFDGVLDFVGGELPVRAVGAALKRRGHVSMLMTAKTSFPHAAWWALLSALRLGPAPRLRNLSRAAGAEGLPRLSAWMEAGRVRMPRVRRVPAAEAARAHELVEGRHAGGKVVLTW